MDDRWRGILIGCGVSALLVCLGVPAAGFLVYKLWLEQYVNMTVNLEEAGVYQGEGMFTSGTLLDIQDAGIISDIRVLPVGPEDTDAIVAVGTTGAGAWELDGTEVFYSNLNLNTMLPVAPEIEIVRLSDGSLAYLRPGSWMDSPALLSQNGGSLWSYTNPSGVNTTAAGDLDGDGTLEFAVGMNGGGGVVILDEQGKQLGTSGGANVWDAAIIDDPVSGAPALVHSHADGKLYIKDATGATLRTAGNPSHYISGFSIMPYPSADGEPHVLLAEDDTLSILDLRGNSVATWEAPGSSAMMALAEGVPFIPEPGAEVHYAVLLTFEMDAGVALFIYDKTGTMIYEEVLSEPTRGMAVLRDAETRADVLLVGGEGKILKYEKASPEAVD